MPPRQRSLFGEVFEVESYLRHQGSSFVSRFDANSYLTVTRAMDWFDLAAEHGGDLFARVRGNQDTLLPGVVHIRLAVPDRAVPRRRTRAQPGGRKT